MNVFLVCIDKEFQSKLESQIHIPSKINTRVFRCKLNFISFLSKECREIHQGLHEEQSCVMKAGSEGKSKAGRRAVPPFPDTKWAPALMRNILSHIFADEHFQETCTQINLELLSV